MVVIRGQKSSKNIYKLLVSTVVGGVASVLADCSVLWHMRLGHMGERGMLELHKRNLLKGVKTCKLDFCKLCILGKQNRVQFKTATHKTEGILDYVHLDVWGPMRTVISLELFDSRPLYLHLLDLVRIVYITFCCSFCVLSYFQVLVEI
jgi:hypothetical protein